MRKIENLILTATVVLGTVVVGRAQDETSAESPWKPEKRQQWREVLADYDYVDEVTSGEHRYTTLLDCRNRQASQRHREPTQ